MVVVVMTAVRHGRGNTSDSLESLAGVQIDGVRGCCSDIFDRILVTGREREERWK
jgi:hypothetical protein